VSTKAGGFKGIMHEYLQYAATVFMGFFAVMNPIANTPIFLSLTSEDDEATRRAVARNALIITFILITIFCVGGKFIFELFGITLSAFRIAGGLLIFLIGLHMLQGEQSSVHNPSDEDKQSSRQAKLSVAVSPLAIPLLGGPGTIATAINFGSLKDIPHLIITMVAFFVLCVILYLFFVFGERLVNYLGQSAINGITRLMGLILAVIGTQMVITGIRGAMTLSHSGS